MPVFKLRSAQSAEDYSLFKTLLLEYAARDLADPANSTIWDDIAQLPGRYAAPQGGVLLASPDKLAPGNGFGGPQAKLSDNVDSCKEICSAELAGCGAFVSTQVSGVAEIKRVYVRRDFRRQGLARSLTQALVVAAREARYQTAGISTWPHNFEALALYQNLGFVPIAPFKEHKHSELVFLGFAL